MNELEVVTTDPPNAGTPLRLLDGTGLGESSVYMRNNFPIPDVLPDHVEIRIGQRHERIEIDDLEKLPRVEFEMVLECAGNGRIFMDPVPDGTPWDLGGVSPVSFGGVPLLDVVGEVPADIDELVFTGADRGVVEPEGTINYQFSLNRDLWNRALLADEMAGRPLAREHGGPLRLVVPGEYAMKSVKWITSIVGTPDTFAGHFVNKYRYFGDSAEPEGNPVGPIQVRAVIASPGEQSVVPVGELRVTGSAWTGTGSVDGVDISLDGGKTWMAASLLRRSGPYSATSWDASVHLAEGEHEVIARARDSEGNVQPLAPRWNGNGYANNVVHRVTFACS